MKKVILYIALLFLFSCKKEIKIEIEDKPSKLVVNAVIDPDSLLHFNLSMTQNITDNSPVPYVTDATVEVFDKDTLPKAILTHLTNGDYGGSSYKPVPGQLYYFRISTVNTVYWFSERMPDTVHCQLQDTSRIVFQGKQNFFQCTLQLTDPPSPNYYGFRVKRFFETYQGPDTIFSEEWLSLETIEFVLTENPKTKFSKKNLLFTDEFFTGPKKLKIGASGLFSGSGQKTKRLVIYTTSYSQNGYNYYSSVNEHLFYQNDPFSQPTLLVGNIPGAYGAAVGTYCRTDTVKFK